MRLKSCFKISILRHWYIVPVSILFLIVCEFKKLKSGHFDDTTLDEREFSECGESAFEGAADKPKTETKKGEDLKQHLRKSSQYAHIRYTKSILPKREQIKTLLEQGETYKEIGATLGWSKARVCLAVKRLDLRQFTKNKKM